LDKVVRKHVWEKLNKDPIFTPQIIERTSNRKNSIRSKNIGQSNARAH